MLAPTVCQSASAAERSALAATLSAVRCMLLLGGGKTRLLSPPGSRLLRGEQLSYLAKTCLLRHLSGRFALVDSCPEARVRARRKEKLDGRQIPFAHGHMQRRSR